MSEAERMTIAPLGAGERLVNLKFGDLEPIPTAPTNTYSVPPPVSPGPKILPFLALTEEDFERLTAAIAEKVDGYSDVRRYGVRGQRQNGVDVLASTDGVNVVGYQAKRYQKFTAADLSRILTEFTRARPLGAMHLIITVACTTNDRKVVNALYDARRRHPDLEIDLRGDEKISDQLFNAPEIVERFFGALWRQYFCAHPAPSLHEMLQHRTYSRSPAFDIEHELAMSDRQAGLGIAERIKIPGVHFDRLKSSRARAILLNRILPRMLTNDMPTWLAADLPSELPLPTVLQTTKIWRKNEKDVISGAVPDSLVEAYNRCEGRLLVLGDAGTGKTHTLFTILRIFLERAQRDPEWPIVLYVPIGDWEGKSSEFERWIIHRLAEIYRVSEKILIQWTNSGIVGLVLDGLDELGWRSRQEAVRGINAFLQDYPLVPLLVACRTKEYKECRRKLAVNGTLEILRPPAEMVDLTFSRAGLEWRHLVATDSDKRRMHQLLRTPLFLQLAVTVVQESANASDPMHAHLDSRNRTLEASLIDRYLDVAQDRATESSNFVDRGINTWLPKLAQNLLGRHLSIFYPDRVALQLLQEKDKRFVDRRTATISAFTMFAITLLVRGSELINVRSGQSFLVFGTMTIIGSILWPTMAYLTAKGSVIREPTARRSIVRKKIPHALRTACLWYILTGITATAFSPSSTAAVFVVFMLAMVTVVSPMRVLAISSEQTDPRDLPAYPGHELRAIAGVAILSGGTLAALIFASFSFVLYPLAPALSLPHSTILSAPYYAVPFGAIVALMNGGNDLICRWVACRVLISQGLLPKRTFRAFDAMRRSSIFVPAAGGLTFCHSVIRDHLASRANAPPATRP